jgi:hypothetical protein
VEAAAHANDIRFRVWVKPTLNPMHGWVSPMQLVPSALQPTGMLGQRNECAVKVDSSGCRCFKPAGHAVCGACGLLAQFAWPSGRRI